MVTDKYIIPQKGGIKMKYFVRSLTIIALVMMTLSCGGGRKEITSGTPGSTIITASDAQKNVLVPEWVEKGMECYGIVVLTFQDGRRTGRAVKSRVMTVRSDRVRMKAIESISFNELVGCDKLGISYGETWWETEGDIFRTKEEAQAYLTAKNWL